MKRYEQLIEGQRYQIYALKKASFLNKDIAIILEPRQRLLAVKLSVIQESEDIAPNKLKSRQIGASSLPPSP